MTESQDEKKNIYEFVASRDGVVFVIDATPKIFEVDPATDETYFAKCLKVYGSILSKKLSWNRADWMGLILFGTTKWDTDPVETRHILTVQKFNEITSNMLSAIIDICNRKGEYYKNLASPSEYPLNDVLWKAVRCFDAVKVGMQRRQVVLLTCRDNPFPDDRAEQHRIRVRAKAFSDMHINLCVVGLEQEWNHDLFYKDIEMLANNVESEDFKPTNIEDLELQMKFGSRVTGHLPWKIGDGVVVRTIISSFSRKTQLLKKVTMSKKTNEVLEKHTHWDQASDLNFSDASDSDTEAPLTLDEPGSILKGNNCGGRMIAFQPMEMKNIRVVRKSGIELLGFKKINEDLSHYIKAVKFIGVDPLATTAEKELFAAMLKKCEAKEVMATCVLSHKTGPYLANLIPCSRYNGFYVYKIAYVEQVNDLEDYTSAWVYVGGENGDRPLPTDNAGVAAMKDIVKRLRFNWDPYMFKNPKLNSQLKYIETLGLDEVAVPVEDTTLPPLEIMLQKLADLPDRVQRVFAGDDCSVGRDDQPEQAQNAAPHDTFDETAIRQLYESRQLESCSCLNLKSYARTLGLRLTGTKVQLVERISGYFNRPM